MRIFEWNDIEWWAGPDLETTIAYAMKVTGLTREEMLEDSTPRELTDEDLDRLVFTEEDGTTKSFRQQLNDQIKAGESFPCIFASTEF